MSCVIFLYRLNIHVETHRFLCHAIEKSAIECSFNREIMCNLSCSSRSCVSKYAYDLQDTCKNTYTGKGVCVCVKSRLFSPRNFPTLSMLCSYDVSRHVCAWPLSAISLRQSINLSIRQAA